MSTEPGAPDRRFACVGDHIVVDLLEPERDLLGHLLPQLREMLMADADPALHRLKPPGRPDDAEAERQFRELIDDDLLLARLEAIEIVEEGIDGAHLDGEGVEAWMKSLNALRLVVSEMLVDRGVDLDDADHPDDADPRTAAMRNWLDWLGGLIWELVEAASAALPDD